MSIAERIPDLDTFLAYSVALEEEAAERHDELADVLETHHNTEVAKIFRKLGHYSRLHAAEVREHAAGRDLPRIAPWDYCWPDLEGPETTDPTAVDYLMTERCALEIALHNERTARDFYAGLGRSGRTEEIRRVAAEFAEEEAGHVALLLQWLERVGEDDGPPRFDPDPPHMPE